MSPANWTLSAQTSGRYHRGADLFPLDQTWPALYTSLAPEVAVWELVRRSAARSLAYLRNNLLSRLEVELDGVLDVSDPTSVGLSREDLTASDHSVCQGLAAAALSQGYQGLLVPSAVPGGVNLVIFPGNLPVPSPIHAVSSVTLPLDVIARGEPR